SLRYSVCLYSPAVSRYDIALSPFSFFCVSFNDTPPTEIYTLSYTTLFRSLHASPVEHSTETGRRRWTPSAASLSRTRAATISVRSEEHTSELQSRVDLVCRLLLEKKKKRYVDDDQRSRMDSYSSHDALHTY